VKQPAIESERAAARASSRRELRFRERRTHPTADPPSKGITPNRNQPRHLVHASLFLRFVGAQALSHTTAAPLTHHWPLWCSRKVILLQYHEKILIIRQQCDHTTEQWDQRRIKLSHSFHSLSRSHHLSHSLFPAAARYRWSAATYNEHVCQHGCESEHESLPSNREGVWVRRHHPPVAKRMLPGGRAQLGPPSQPPINATCIHLTARLLWHEVVDNKFGGRVCTLKLLARFTYPSRAGRTHRVTSVWHPL